METTTGNKFTKTLALFLPGIFLLGFNIGTGSVTSMAVAGADYGMSLLWTIVASNHGSLALTNVIIWSPPVSSPPRSHASMSRR